MKYNIKKLQVNHRRGKMVCVSCNDIVPVLERIVKSNYTHYDIRQLIKNLQVGMTQ